ncbi:MAG TPA: hypothetical protein VMT17_15615 [Anaeromyxobacteraceae bacterium]|nr:hypothetical protein [Anaeromyxobacteraceae bacterium]
MDGPEERVPSGLLRFRVPPGGEPAEVRGLLASHERYQALRRERSRLTLALPIPVALAAVGVAWPASVPTWARELAFGATAALVVWIPVVFALELHAWRRVVRGADALGRGADGPP